MQFITQVLPIAALAAIQVSAAPLTSNGTSHLMTRAFTIDGCSQDETDKINQALSDAAVLARFTSTSKNGAAFSPNSPAFTKYLNGAQAQNIANMYTAIGQQYANPAQPINREPNDPVQVQEFNVRFTCKDPDKHCDGKGTKSYAVTDATPAANGNTPTIIVCPLFFNDKRTKHNLNSIGYAPSTGRRGGNTWCKPGQKFRDLEVAGATMLHELTHLDEAGVRAGLTDRPLDRDDSDNKATSHGTEDIYGKSGDNYGKFKYSTDPQTAAIQLHNNWVNNAGPPPFAEDENAESYSAAALEWWFIQQCNFATVENNN